LQGQQNSENQNRNLPLKNPIEPLSRIRVVITDLFMAMTPLSYYLPLQPSLFTRICWSQLSSFGIWLHSVQR
jgi:hypothetical protein